MSVKLFKVLLGTVRISRPYRAVVEEVYTDVVDVSYTPDDTHGWGITQQELLTNVTNWDESDAMTFALVAESMLRIHELC